MLTEEKLKEMEPAEVFAGGIDKYRGRIIKWVAVRGRGYWDWAVYYTEDLMRPEADIADWGEKLYQPELLLDFDESAQKLYRK